MREAPPTRVVLVPPPPAVELGEAGLRLEAARALLRSRPVEEEEVLPEVLRWE